MKRLLRSPTASVSILLLTAVLALALGCQTSPATGQSQLNVLTEQEELEIGEELGPEFLAENGGPIPSDTIQRYVSDLGVELAAVSERPDLPWEFHAVDSAVINAFALPGGKVFVSRGLLMQMENEAQLAAVLGHEIGHVTDQHIGQQMSRAVAAQFGLGLLGYAVSGQDWGQVVGIGVELATGFTLLSFSREQENVADVLGMRYMTDLGYNPLAAVEVMEILRQAGGAGGVEWLSTHPAPDTRVRRIQDIIEQDYPEARDTGRYSYHRDRFQRTVTQELETLPPPQHDPQQQQQSQRQPAHGHASSHR